MYRQSMMAAASVALGGGGGEGGEGGGGEGGRGGRGGGGGGGSSRKDFISDLPAELGVLILSQLDIKDLFRSSAVCQRWRKLTIHYDFLYGPHLIKKHDHVTHGRDPITASRAGMSQELLQRYPKLSASEYFASPKSLRDLALRDLYLLKRWNAGIPTRTINLNTRRAPEHAAVILSVLVDPVYKILISGDKSGKVVFWSTHTERPVRSIELRDKEPITSNDPAISAMALGTDYLVIGTWQMTVHVLKRDGESTHIDTRAFSLVAQFPVSAEVISILIEGSTCIVGCANGEIAFWDLGMPGQYDQHQQHHHQGHHDHDHVKTPPKEASSSSSSSSLSLEEDEESRRVPRRIIAVQNPSRGTIRNRVNLSMYYRKPFLFTSSTLLSQFTPKRVDIDNRRDLWEYQEIRVKTCGPPPSCEPGADDPDNLCLLHPLRDDGELLVAWPDMTVFSLSGFNGSAMDVPDARFLADRPHDDSIRSLGSGDGIFVTGSLDHTIGLFSEEGVQLQKFHHEGDVTCVATDPCFFVSVSDDRSVKLWDFTPPHWHHPNGKPRPAPKFSLQQQQHSHQHLHQQHQQHKHHQNQQQKQQQKQQQQQQLSCTSSRSQTSRSPPQQRSSSSSRLMHAAPDLPRQLPDQDGVESVGKSGVRNLLQQEQQQQEGQQGTQKQKQKADGATPPAIPLVFLGHDRR